MTRRMTQKEFEAREVFKRGELKRLRSTGYEAYRVSPRVTKKYGKGYRKIYGATVEPDYSRGKSGKYGAIVKWYPHGFTTKSVKSGTRMLAPLRHCPVMQSEARSKLMLRRRISKKRRRR